MAPRYARPDSTLPPHSPSDACLPARPQARVRELLAAEERCGALEGRVATLLGQHESLADRLHAAQAESEGWRSALGKLSEELASVSAREAAARSALRDTADRLLVQQQLSCAQAEELELLRAKVARLQQGAQLQGAQRGQATACAPPQQHQPQQQHALQQEAAAASSEDEGSPRSRRAGKPSSSGFSWGRMFKGT